MEQFKMEKQLDRDNIAEASKPSASLNFSDTMKNRPLDEPACNTSESSKKSLPTLSIQDGPSNPGPGTPKPDEDPGKTIYMSNGTRITSWKDGTVREQVADGTGFVRFSDGREKHWGPNKTDNWSFRFTEDGGREKSTADGTVTTYWPDGAVRVTYADGTGYTRNPNGDINVMQRGARK